MKVAIAHDYLVQYGGAERVVEVIHDLWPDAPLFTSIYDADAMPDAFRSMDVRTSFLQNVPGLARHSKLGLPAYPRAFASLELHGYDVVVSSSSGWAHGVRTDLDALHIVYCHNPARWLYRSDSYLAGERALAAPLLPALKRWDRRAASRANRYIANSETTRRRILAAYGCPSTVLHPPVDTRRFELGEPDDFFLCASRLTAYKRIDLAIEACHELGVPLRVAGDGPARSRLERSAAGRDVDFLGRVSDRELASLLGRCRALIVPAEEDFCITAVEAMAAGRPVVGYARGGLVETVLPDRTGVLFASQTLEGVTGAIRRLERLELEPAAIRRHALRFDTSRFRDELARIVEDDLGVTVPAAEPAVRAA
ncbi:MAG TPA: glycosyltransferase [Gaiellaceae bacterium]|nr:glycosyltransferase [Gaiellaceae bacterium]